MSAYQNNPAVEELLKKLMGGGQGPSPGMGGGGIRMPGMMPGGGGGVSFPGMGGGGGLPIPGMGGGRNSGGFLGSLPGMSMFFGEEDPPKPPAPLGSGGLGAFWKSLNLFTPQELAANDPWLVTNKEASLRRKAAWAKKQAEGRATDTDQTALLNRIMSPLYAGGKK